MSKPCIILFGGSFDPIHYGHIAMAEFATHQLVAQKLFFIPALRSPHKADSTSASGNQRLEMIRRSIKDHAVWEISECELVRSEPSYTFDTVCYFRNRYGMDTELCWLVGADTVTDLHRWYRINDILDMCRICILHRGGVETPSLQHLEGRISPQHIIQLRKDILISPLVDISSTKIREEIANGEDVRRFLPARVWEFIEQNKLYGYNTA